MQTTALALEYERDYGIARRNVNFANLVNDPAGQSESGIFCLSLQEQIGDILLANIGPLNNDRADALLVSTRFRRSSRRWLPYRPGSWRPRRTLCSHRSDRPRCSPRRRPTPPCRSDPTGTTMLPIGPLVSTCPVVGSMVVQPCTMLPVSVSRLDRKSTRLNSSHL